MARRGAIIAGQSNDTVPSAPTITSITPGNGYLDVNFTAGVDGGRPITGYEYRTDELGAWSIASGTTSPIRISSLFNGTMYHVRIRAINMEGTGPQSNLISQSPYTVPSAPTISTISIGVKSLSVSGSAGSDNGSTITNYKYSINDDLTFTAFSPAQTSFPLVISGLADATTYPVVVRAVNAAGDGLVSNTVSQITASAPAKPSPPTITSVGNATISISWVPPAANNSTITSYAYQRSSDDGANWTTVASTASTSADIASLTNGTSYKFRVNATNAAGTSEWSEKSLADAPWTTPGAPTSVTAVKGDTVVDVSWIAPADTGGYPISTYRLDYKAGSGAWVGGGSATGTSKQITGLTNGTTYTFRVQASNTRSITTFGAFGESNTAKPSGVPNQVAKPTLTAGDKNISVTWVSPGSNGSDITGFKIQYSSNGGTSWTSGGTAVATATTKDITVTNGSTYIARVLAYNANGDGSYSTASDSATPSFAAPTASASSSSNKATPYVRTMTISFNPPDAVNYDRTEVYVAYDGQEGYLTDANTLKATKTSGDGVGDLSISFTAVNQYYDYGEFGTFWTLTDLAYDNLIRYRVVTYNTDGYSRETTGYHYVQARQSENYNDWVYTSGVDVYATGTWTLSSNAYSSTGSGHTSASSIGGVGLNVAVGDTQYTLTSLVITANSGASYSASTSTRYFVVDFSGTNTTLAESVSNMTNVTETSTASYTWAGFGNTGSQSYTWNITNVDYGNPGAGRVRLRKLGASTSPPITASIVARGNKRVWTTFTTYW